MTRADDYLVRTLSTVEPFSTLDEPEVRRFAAAGECIALDAGEVVFAEGSTDHQVFFLLNGQIELTAAGALHTIVSADEARAPLGRIEPRRFTATARVGCTVFRISRAAVEHLDGGAARAVDEVNVQVREIADDAGDDWLTRMLRSELFSRLPVSNIQRLFARMQPMRCEAGEVVIRQGAQDNDYFIIREGKCRVSRVPDDDGDVIRLADLGAGETFGEEALVSGNPRCATVTMLTAGVLMRISAQDFGELIHAPLVASVDRAEALRLADQGACILEVGDTGATGDCGLDAIARITPAAVRLHAQTLSKDVLHVVCGESVPVGACAAFLLLQHGLDACYLKAGWNHDEDATVVPAAAVRPRPAAEPDPVLETAARLVEVQRERVATAGRLQAEQAALETRMSATESRLADALRLREEAESAHRQSQAVMEDSLRTTRDQLEAESARAEAAVQEVARLRAEVGEARRAVEQERERKREREHELERIRREAETRLEREEERLREGFRRQGEVGSAEGGAAATTEAAKAEAARIYKRYRDSLKRAIAQEQARLKADRQQLETEAAQVRALLEEMRTMRQHAESEKLAAVKRSALLHAPLSPRAPIEDEEELRIELPPELEPVPQSDTAEPARPEGWQRWVEADADSGRVLSRDKLAALRRGSESPEEPPVKPAAGRGAKKC